MYDYTSIYEIKRYSDKYYSWIISQSWLTNHLMTYPPDFEISLSPLKLLLSNNKKKKKKGKKLLLGASFSSESILSKPASTKMLDPGRK